MKIIFAGTSEFAVSFLQTLYASGHEICAVYTQPDRPAGRGLQLRPSPVKQLAEQYNLPICQPDSFRNEAIVHELRSFNADIMVDVAYGLLLPKSVLDAFPYGCINVHPSLLPRWRGAAPIERAILDGDYETGITIMQVDEGWDSGDILRQQRIYITETDTSDDLYHKLAVVGEPLLLETLNDIAKHQVVAVKQDDSLSCYAKKINKEEAKISWSKSAIELDRKVRAFNPRPIAYTYTSNEPILGFMRIILHSSLNVLQSEKLKIEQLFLCFSLIRMSKYERNLIPLNPRTNSLKVYCAKQLVRIWRAVAITSDNSISPGTIVAADKNGIDVVTGDGILRLLELQLSGGKVLQASQLLNAKRELFAVGRKFDG